MTVVQSFFEHIFKYSVIRDSTAKNDFYLSIYTAAAAAATIQFFTLAHVFYFTFEWNLMTVCFGADNCNKFLFLTRHMKQKGERVRERNLFAFSSYKVKKIK
jgi:hypothetical protein